MGGAGIHSNDSVAIWPMDFGGDCWVWEAHISEARNGAAALVTYPGMGHLPRSVWLRGSESFGAEYKRDGVQNAFSW